MEKASLNKWLAVLFCAAIFTVPALFFLLPRQDFSEREKRFLDQAPPLSAQNLADGSYMAALDGYVSDHFPGRTFFVGLNAYYELLSGRQATKDYRLRDGRLFAAPAELDEKTLASNREAVDSFCRELREGGSDVPVTLMLVPSPGALLSDGEDYPDAALIERVNAQTEARTVDLMAAFSACGDPGALYYRTDHHWTSEGAFEALCAYRRALGRSEPAREDCQIERCEGFYGSAYAGSGLWLTEPDSLELWLYGSEVRVSNEGGGENDSVFYRERLEELDKYTVFLDGNHSLVRIEKTEPDGGGTILVIRDSYANCLGCHLAGLYDRVILVDLRYYRLPLTELLLTEEIDEILIEYSVDNFLHDKNLAFLTIEPEKLREERRAEEEARRLAEEEAQRLAEEEARRLALEQRPPNYFAPPQAISPEMFKDAYYLGDSVIGPLISYCAGEGLLADAFLSTNPKLSYHETVNLVRAHLIYDGRYDLLPTVLRDRQPPVVIGALGCNDLAAYDTAHTEEMLLRFLDMVREEVPDAVIFIQSVMPIRGGMEGFGQSEIDEFNAWLKANAETGGYCYIELDRYFKDEDGELSRAWMYNATHLIPEGGARWYRELMNIDNYYNFPERFFVEYDGATDRPVGEAPEPAGPEEAPPPGEAPAAPTETPAVPTPEPVREETALDRVYARLCAELSLPEMMALSERTARGVLGLEAADYPNSRFYLCANNLKADEIWLVETRDEAAAQALLALARERIEIKAQSYDQYMPEESALARRGIAVSTGRWVGLFISPDAEAMKTLFLEELGEGP